MDAGNAGSSSHWLDRLYLGLARAPLCMSLGWGDPEVLELMGQMFRVSEPEPLVPRWGREWRAGGLRIVDGVVPSPLERLAPECRDVHVRWLLPERVPVRGTYVLLASWAEEGYAMRTWLAARLAREGLAVLLLENAFYGKRRSAGQRGPILQRLSDFVLMGLAVYQEARGLLAYLRAEGQRPGIAGYSMGGQLALMVGASIPWGLPIVGMAPSASPGPVFTEGPLQAGIDWAALGKEGPARARERVSAALGAISVLALPPPVDPGRAIIVGTTRDGIVSPGDMQAIANHWRAELRWLPAGHVSAVVFHRRALQQALLDAFARSG